MLLRSFEVRNFRGFRDLSLEPLERVNLIVGQNNLGKTALLEALFIQLRPAIPELVSRLSRYRGIEPLVNGLGEVWAWLFYCKRTDKTIEFRLILVSGGVPMVHGDVGVGPPIPLPLMGEGVARSAALLLAIAAAPRGSVLVDDIEYGLHYSVLPGIWKAIAAAAREYDTQIFGTTHSWECAEAAHRAFLGEDAYEFSLRRLERVNGDLTAVTYTQETLETSLEMHLEIR